MRTVDDLRVAQKIISAHQLKHPKCAVFAQMGLGKSGATITTLAQLLNCIQISRALVIAPLRVAKKTWPDEFKVWEHAKHITYFLLWGAVPKETPNENDTFGEKRVSFWSRKLEKLKEELLDLEIEWPHERNAKYKKAVNEKKREISKAKRILDCGKIAVRNQAEVHLINRDNVVWLVHFWGKYWPYQTVIFDESSGLKSGKKAARWRALRQVMPQTERFIQLTGTPAANGLMGLWAQIYLLDGGERLGRTISEYRERYFVADYMGYKYEPKPGAKDAIFEKISDICVTLRSEDFMDLPPTTYNQIPVVLSEDDYAKYKKLQKHYILELTNGGEIEAASASALSLKLQQLANGIVYDEDRLSHVVHTAKLDAMEEFVEELHGAPVLVAYWFKHDLPAIQARFPHFRVLDDSDEVQDEWNAGRIPGLLIHPQSGGHGLNIQFGGRTILWYGPIYDLELYQQLNERLAGARATGATFIHHLIADGTIDGYMMTVLSKKDADQNDLFDALKCLISDVEL